MKTFPIFCICTILLGAVSAGCQNNPKNTEPKQDEVEDTNSCSAIEFFGIPLRGKSVSAIVDKMVGKVDVLHMKGAANDTTRWYVVDFCNVPCGMNLKWKKQGETYYITSLNFFTSQQTPESVHSFINGISSFYGKPYDGDEELEDDDIIIYKRFQWDNVVLRNVHSDEGGLIVLF